MIYLFDERLKLTKKIPMNCLLSAIANEGINLITAELEVVADGVFDGVSYFGFPAPDQESNYWVFKITGTVTETTRKVTGVHIFYDELKAYYIKDIRPNQEPAGGALSRFLAATGWSVRTNHTTKKTSKNAYYISVYEAVQNLIQETGVEIRPYCALTGTTLDRKVDVFDQMGEFTGRRFVSGKNGVHITAKEDTSAIYTAILGRGKGLEKKDGEDQPTGGFTRRLLFEDVEWKKSNGDPVDKPKGQPYVELPEATAQYGLPNGKPRIGILEFNDIEDPKELLKASYDQLLEQSRPKVTLNVSKSQSKGVRLGDIVWAIVGSSSFKTRVFRATHNLLDKRLTAYEFGDRIVNSTTERLNIIKRTTQAQFSSIHSEIASLYWGEDGYNYDLKKDNPYHLPAGYYSFDKPINKDPKKVIYMGAGKMMISNERDSSGQWIWKTVATGDGYYAQHMFADSITGDMIKGKVLQSQAATTGGEPVTYINLDTGQTNIGGGIVYDPSGDNGKGSIDLYGNLFVDTNKYGTRKKVADIIDQVATNTDAASRAAQDAYQASREAQEASQRAEQAGNLAYQSANLAVNTANKADALAQQVSNTLTRLCPSVNENGMACAQIYQIYVVTWPGNGTWLEMRTSKGTYSVQLK